jgi:hypothetical protein
VSHWLHYTLVWSFEVPFLALSILVWLPRIRIRSSAAEQARDPEGFRHRQRREKIYGCLGFVLGLIAAVTGAYLGIKAQRPL